MKRQLTTLSTMNINDKRSIILIIAGLLILACYGGHGLSPTGQNATDSSGISGTVKFIGNWPDSTFQVIVVASKSYPRNITDKDSLYDFISNELILENIILSDTIPMNVDQYNYTLNLKPGVYEWILIAWFPDIPEYFKGAKELGAYYSNSDSIPESVYVPPGEFVENIDIIADFKNIHRELPFFKK
ncbi:hypothetical protein JW835_02235 [bacterium]|nr:hypothetical protein [bacterium]